MIPDAGSVTLSIRDHSGALLAGWDKAPVVDTLSTQVNITLPADVFLIDVADTYQARYLTLDFLVATKPHSSETILRVGRWLPLQIDGNAVRALIGLEYEELPDESMDIRTAYYELAAEHGTAFSDAFVSTGPTSFGANRAVGFKILLNAFASLPQRILQSEKDEYAQWVRNKTDFADLREALEAALSESLADISSTLGSVLPTVFAVTDPTDPITGGT